MDFVTGSSTFAQGLNEFWGAFYHFVKPLVEAGEGAVKLLKLIK